MIVLVSAVLGPVFRRPISANPGLNLNNLVPTDRTVVDSD